MESLYLIGIAVLGIFAFVLAIVLFNFFGLWLRARIANAPVSLGKMIGMRLRKVPPTILSDIPAIRLCRCRKCATAFTITPTAPIPPS